MADDTEEEERQKTLKGLLDTFEKTSVQILDVGFTYLQTLEGLTDQIYDKALIEPHL